MVVYDMLLLAYCPAK